MGAINLIGSFLAASELITIPGRVFLVSAPIVESKLINQISLLLETDLVFNNITC